MEDLILSRWFSLVAGIGWIGGPPRAIKWNQHLHDKCDEAYAQANENLTVTATVTALRGPEAVTKNAMCELPLLFNLLVALERQLQQTCLPRRMAEGSVTRVFHE